jgi:hypothetical protein
MFGSGSVPFQGSLKVFNRANQRPPARKVGSFSSTLFQRMKCQAYCMFGTVGVNSLETLLTLTL